MNDVLDKNKIWKQYLDYLREWIETHSDVENLGDYPMAFWPWWGEKSHEVFEK